MTLHEKAGPRTPQRNAQDGDCKGVSLTDTVEKQRQVVLHDKIKELFLPDLPRCLSSELKRMSTFSLGSLLTSLTISVL